MNNMDFDAQLIVNSGQMFRTPTPDMIDPSDDYDEIKRELMAFPELRAPIANAPNLRVLRQPFIECVISFIVSANNNIKRFSKTLAQMQFNIEWLQSQTEDDFRRMGCGYRAAYLVKAARQLAKMNFDELNAMDDMQLNKKLCEISGVGDKVARCVMLFAFHRLNIVPVDTWIEKVYKQLTDDKKPRTAKYMAEWLENRYGKYAGVAQQYIFYYTQYLRKDLQIHI